MGEVSSGPTAATAGAADTLRLLTWNIAHGRGTPDRGLLSNFAGGGPDARQARLQRIAEVIQAQDADVVVLNEADFSATWSQGVDHAATVAAGAGYPVRVEQANYDLRLPFFEAWFGNAVLSRRPVRGARTVALPPHRAVEPWLLGAKRASVVRLESRAGPVALVPVHLEARSPDTRTAALPALTGVATAETAPVILAGDFNASPPGWGARVQRVGPGGRSPPRPTEAPPATTVVGALLDAGFRSPRAEGAPDPGTWTYPNPRPDRAIDWVLVEPPIEVLEARVLDEPDLSELSDHRPVLSVVRIPGPVDRAPMRPGGVSDEGRPPGRRP